MRGSFLRLWRSIRDQGDKAVRQAIFYHTYMITCSSSCTLTFEAGAAHVFDILHYPLLEELKLYNNSYGFWGVLFLQKLDFIL